MTLRVRHFARVNPSTPSFDALPVTGELTFMPLETVWADRRLDTSRVAVKADVSSGYVRFQDGDVLLPKTAPTFQHARATVVNRLQNGVGAGSSELHLLRPEPGVDARFLAYVVRCPTFIAEGVTAYQGVAGLQRVPSDFVADWPIAVTNVEEQRRLADFLDDQVARFNRAVALRKEQLETLTERTLASVSEILAPPARSAVGHPNAPWLSPRSGSLTKLSSVCTLQSGVTVNAGRTTGVEYPYLRVANVQNGVINLDEVKRIVIPVEAARRSLLQPGDVLMTEGGDIDKLGRGSVWQGEIESCLHQNHVFALRPNTEALLPEYLAAMTRTHHARCYFESTGSQSTNLASTNSSKVLAFRFPLPSLNLQEVKLREVRRSDESAQRLSTALRAQIALLHERKGALITAAVTGQFDVTTASAAVA